MACKVNILGNPSSFSKVTTAFSGLLPVSSSLVLLGASEFGSSNMVAGLFGLRLGSGRLKPIGLCVTQRCHGMAQAHFHLLADVFLAQALHGTCFQLDPCKRFNLPFGILVASQCGQLRTRDVGSGSDWAMASPWASSMC